MELFTRKPSCSLTAGLVKQVEGDLVVIGYALKT